jgi:hypothetical protein
MNKLQIFQLLFNSINKIDIHESYIISSWDITSDQFCCLDFSRVRHFLLLSASVAGPQKILELFEYISALKKNFQCVSMLKNPCEYSFFAPISRVALAPLVHRQNGILETTQEPQLRT